MRAIIGAGVGVGVLLTAVAARADVTLVTNVVTSGSLNSLIPDANISGFQSTLVGSGFEGYITSVSLTLNVQGGYNGDLYAYIAHSTGFSVLLNRVGRTDINPFGYADGGFSVTLSDEGLTDIHLAAGSGSPVTGVFQPDARNFDPAFVTDSTTRSSNLSSFQNLDPNGLWTLFIADMSGGDQSQLQNWQLNIVTAVPEPGSITLVLAGLSMFASGCYLRRRKTDKQ